MSSNPPLNQSPIRRRTSYQALADGGRWTVDNSESRFHSLANKPPKRSILKGSQTPFRFNSPLFQHEQERRHERLAQRRVSFAPDAHLRVFNEDDTLDITNRGIPNLIEEQAPSFLSNDALNSPLFEDSTFLRRLIGSPSDRRKRRPDLFGSPPGCQRSPKRRLGGQPPSLLNRVYDQNQENTDLTQYLSSRYQKGRRNIFEEDDDDEEEEEEQEAVVEQQHSQLQQQQPQPQLQEIVQRDDTMDEDDMVITQTMDNPFTLVSDEEEEEEAMPLLDEETMQITLEMPIHYSPGITPPRLSPTPQRPSMPPASPLSRFPNSPAKRSILTPRETSTTYSPNRQFYLHERSPLQRSQLREQETYQLHEPGSTMSDRMLSLQNENDDILQEEYSQLYNSFNNGIPALENTSLADFLTYVGITFPEDTPAKELRRRSTYNVQYGPSTTADQTYAASSTLPELDIYQKACDQLKDLIRNSKDAVDRIDEEISSANPQFFHEYFDAQQPIRAKTEQRLKEIKQYANLKSAASWYEWWISILKRFLDTLKANHEKLDQDKQVTQQLEQRLLSKVSDVLKYQDQLAKALGEAREKETAFNQIDHEQLKSLEKEIEVQKASLQSFKNEAEVLESQEFELLEKEALLEKQKSELNEKINQAKTTLENNKFITVRELVEAKDKFNRCSKIGGWKLEKADNNIIQINLDEDIDVMIDQTKLAEKSEDAVLIRMLDSRDRILGPLADLVAGLKVVAKDKWDMNEIMEDIAIYWNRVGMVKRELTDIQRRFWVEIKSLENAEEPEDAGFSCEICFFSFMGKTKFTLSFQIKPKDILDYPFIDTSTWKLEVYYGALTHDELKALIDKEVSREGMIGLADTLRSVLEQVSIPNQNPPTTTITSKNH